MIESPEQLIRDVSRRIAVIREARGLTLTELARQIEMGYQNLARIERGEQNLTLRTMTRIANALGVRTIDLLAPPDAPIPAPLR